jgi:hypothetical protein
MANLLKESFAIENIADFAAGKWTSGTPNAVGTAQGRLGGYGVQILGGNDLKYNIPGTPGTIIVGGAYYFRGAQVRMMLSDVSNTTQMYLYHDSNTSLLSVRNWAGTILGSYTVLLNAWNYIEFKIVLSTSTTGSFTTQINGVNIPALTFTGIKTSNTTTAAGILQFSGDSGGDNYNFADVYVNDTTGSTNNSFMGDIKQLTGRPIGAGLNTNWAIGGTSPAATNWQSVNDAQPNYDVTYVDDLTPGDIDLYPMSVPSGLNTFESLTVYSMVRKDDAGTRQVAVCISNGTTVFVGPTYTIGTTYSYIQGTWDSNPFTSAAWIVADASTLQIGIKVIS